MLIEASEQIPEDQSSKTFTLIELQTKECKNIPNFDYSVMINDPIIIEFQEYIIQKLKEKNYK